MMNYWAIVKDVWAEAWARRTVITLSCVVVFLVGLYGWGVQVRPSEANPELLALYFFDGDEPIQGLLSGGEQAFAMNPTTVAQLSLIIALGLLSPSGILFGLILTIGFFRDTLRPQKLYWILSKPISRSGLLLSRFAGTTLLVAVPTFVFMGAMMLLAFWKTDVLVNGALWAALIIVFEYMSFAAVALLVAIWTQSTALSMMAAIGLFFIAGLLNPQTLSMFGSGWWQTALEGLYYILPKTSDLGTLAVQAVYTGVLPSQALPDVNATLAWGSTFAFLVVVLGISLWEFQRRDY